MAHVNSLLERNHLYHHIFIALFCLARNGLCVFIDNMQQNSASNYLVITDLVFFRTFFYFSQLMTIRITLARAWPDSVQFCSILVNFSILIFSHLSFYLRFICLLAFPVHFLAIIRIYSPYFSLFCHFYKWSKFDFAFTCLCVHLVSKTCGSLYCTWRLIQFLTTHLGISCLFLHLNPIFNPKTFLKPKQCESIQRHK